jgi:hypothetical protein
MIQVKYYKIQKAGSTRERYLMRTNFKTAVRKTKHKNTTEYPPFRCMLHNVYTANPNRIWYQISGVLMREGAVNAPTQLSWESRGKVEK